MGQGLGVFNGIADIACARASSQRERTFKLGNDPIGQRAFEAIQDTLEGTVSTMDYNFAKAGKPAIKQSLEIRVGNQGCGVSYYK